MTEPSREKNIRPGAFDHKFNKSHEHKATVLKANANLGCHDRNTISKAREVIVSGFSALLGLHLAYCVLRMEVNIQGRKTRMVRHLATKSNDYQLQEVDLFSQRGEQGRGEN